MSKMCSLDQVVTTSNDDDDVLSLSLNGKAPRKVVVFSRAARKEDATISSSLSRAFLLVEDKELFSENIEIQKKKKKKRTTPLVVRKVVCPFLFCEVEREEKPTQKKNKKLSCKIIRFLPPTPLKSVVFSVSLTP